MIHTLIAASAALLSTLTFNVEKPVHNWAAQLQQIVTEQRLAVELPAEFQERFEREIPAGYP